MATTYEKWLHFTMTDEENSEWLENLAMQRNNPKLDPELFESYEVTESDLALVETFKKMGIVASLDPNGSLWERFLSVANITLDELNILNVNPRLFNDGFIIPSWGTNGSFLFCVNHNKHRASGLDAKYINVYPDEMKEKLSNFRFYGLESTNSALEKGYICVCEGIFDRIRLESEGIPAITTLGSQISKTQLRVLNRFDKVILIGDNDRAGLQAQEIIMKGVKRTQQIKIGYAKDIDELAINNPYEYQKLIQQIKL